jgi:hypothetical protein
MLAFSLGFSLKAQTWELSRSGLDMTILALGDLYVDRAGGADEMEESEGAGGHCLVSGSGAREFT